MKRTRLPVAFAVLPLAVGILTACSAENASSVSGVIVVYPAVRTTEDEAELERIAPKALAISQAGAALSPKAEGFSDTLALWRQGSLATFSTSGRGVAEALMVLAVAKDKGGPTDITLNREGDKVYIVELH
ncbi:MAG TPA: hypothetical protein VI700_00380 [Thermoanaerobaculaceae bacterium]|nr:hypothetical protein [Thermoanaerobaculaceae bacterium]